MSVVAPFPHLSTKQSIQLLQKWTYRHISALLWGSIQALELKRTPELAKTHIFYVTLELTSEARAGTRLRANRIFKVVDAISIRREELAQIWPVCAPNLSVPPTQEGDVITTTIVRCGEYFDFLDALHRESDLRAGQNCDEAWKVTLLEATKPSDREFDIVKTDPLQYDVD